jgi:hypothetical protein
MAKRRVETPFWRIFGSAIPAVARMVVVAHDLRWVSQEEGRPAVANDVEVLGMRLLRALNEEAIGDLETAVLAEDVARRARFDYGSENFDAALQYLLRCGYLKSHYIVGGEAYMITPEGLEKLAK